MAVTTTSHKYQYAKKLITLWTQWLSISKQLVEMQTVFTARTWQTGGAEAITDADLAPADATIGPPLGLTAATLNIAAQGAINGLKAYLAGTTVTNISGGMEAAVDSIRIDVC